MILLTFEHVYGKECLIVGLNIDNESLVDYICRVVSSVCVSGAKIAEYNTTTRWRASAALYLPCTVLYCAVHTAPWLTTGGAGRQQHDASLGPRTTSACLPPPLRHRLPDQDDRYQSNIIL